MIDAWSGPTPTPQQFPKNEPEGIRKLLDKIKALELQVRESTSNLLATAGIRLTRLGMFIDSSLTVSGDLTATGDTTIGGNAAITGTLSLPAGIVGNAALTSPSVSQEVYFSAANFALSTSPATKASATVTVPAGFTKAVVTLVARAIAINPNTTGGTNGLGADYFRVQPTIGAATGAAMPLSTGGNSGSNINVAPFTDIRTGMAGGQTFVLGIDVWTDYLSWGSNASNWAVMSGSITWTR